jgi:gliding motility-associated-like protein
LRKIFYHSSAWLIFFLCLSTVAFAQLSANFSASVTEGCSPLKVQFTDLSTGTPTSWLWDFGNGQTSTLKNPLVTYSAAGVYSVSLTVKNATGSGNTVKSNYIVVDTLPQAQFISKITGCIPLIDTFTDQSIAGSGILTSWFWNFGDGGTSTAQNPIHTYSTGGTYTVSLMVQNSKGCRDTLVVDTLVHTGSKPTAAFAYPVLYTCASDPVKFFNKSTGTVTSWLWTFGDGDSSTKQSPAHYFQDTGYLKIILRAINNGCVDSFETKNLYVKPPIVKYGVTHSCIDPYTITFRGKFLGATSFYWDFGDGSPTSKDVAPVHTFPDTGSFKVILYATGPECNYADSGFVPIVHEQPVISTNKPSMCRNDSANFVATNYNPFNLVSFAWNFGDGTSTNGSTKNSASHSFSKTGTYPVSLIVQDVLGCYDTVINNTNVYGPVANFTNIAATCIKNPVTFTDQSATDGTNAITKWTWDFGDGSINSFTDSPFVHSYSVTNTFSIKLKVTDSFGCFDTITHPNALTTVARPISAFTVSDTTNCFSDSVSFTDNSQGSALGRTWNFGDGATSTLAAPSHTYADTGHYIVTLVIGTEVGCSDTSSKAVEVLPLPNVDAGNDSVLCLGQTVRLQVNGASTYMWTADPSLSCLSCNNPVAAPQTNTTYFVKGTDAFGCTASDSISIEVKQPITLSLTKMDTVCLGNSVQLTASGAEIYSWQPPAGLNNSNIPNPVATPSNTGNITYTVTGTDRKNCFSDTASTTLVVAPYPQFNIIDSNITIAAGGTYVIQTTSSPDVISWQWSPSTDLSCTNCPQPVAKGNKIVRYTGIASNAYGCSVSDNILVRGLCSSEVIFIPNTFSPNGDHVNDYFYPRGQGLYLIKSMRIFNRLGQMVFEKTNFSPDVESEGWNGTFNSKKLPSDVYVYFIEVMCNNGVVVPFKGNVTLIY